MAETNSNKPNSLEREAEGWTAEVKVALVSRAPLRATLTSQHQARHMLQMAPAWHAVADSSHLFAVGRSQALPRPPGHKEGSVLPVWEQPWENRLCLCIPATTHGCKWVSRRATAWQPPLQGAQPPSREVQRGDISPGVLAEAAVPEHLRDTTHWISQDRQE